MANTPMDPTTQPQRAAQLGLEDFIEAATRAALRAVEAHVASQGRPTIQPQPLPPGAATTSAPVRPRIFIGIVATPEE